MLKKRKKLHRAKAEVKKHKIYSHLTRSPLMSHALNVLNHLTHAGTRQEASRHVLSGPNVRQDRLSLLSLLARSLCDSSLGSAS